MFNRIVYGNVEIGSTNTSTYATLKLSEWAFPYYLSSGL
jgi:hypothetical protein